MIRDIANVPAAVRSNWALGVYARTVCEAVTAWEADNGQALRENLSILLAVVYGLGEMRLERDVTLLASCRQYRVCRYCNTPHESDGNDCAGCGRSLTA